MGFEDLVGQGKKFLEDNQDQIGDALKSEQAEQISDTALDAAAGHAKNVAPDAADGTIDDVRAGIDAQIGNQEKTPGWPGHPIRAIPVPHHPDLRPHRSPGPVSVSTDTSPGVHLRVRAGRRR